MDFNIPASHETLRQKVREFAETHIKPVAQELDQTETFSSELTQRMGELGLFGIYVPEALGGGGMDFLANVIAVEELSRVDASQASTLSAHNSLGIGPFLFYGTNEQKMNYLPKLCKGDAIWAFGLTEPTAGSDIQGVQTEAKKVDGGWVLNGEKAFITNASNPLNVGMTIQAITSVKDGKKRLSCFIVDRDAEGLSVEPIKGKLMWRSGDTARIYLKDVKVSDDALLGEEGKGAAQMLETLDSGRLAIAAMGVGGAQGAYELALNYANKREQFGKPISKFQVNAFKLADMHMKIEHARTYLYKACWLRDTGQPFSKEAAMSKLFAAEVASEVTDHAVQLMGANGLVKENDVERFFRDQRLLPIGEGTSEVMRLVISRHLGC